MVGKGNVLVLSGGLELSILGPLDDLDLLGKQLQDLPLGDSSTLNGGKKRLIGGERRDVGRWMEVVGGKERVGGWVGRKRRWREDG